VGFGAQPKVSRDAVAEFQIVTNVFDITQGRSLGMQVQAITKSGGNTLSGSAYGYFRGDKLDAPDPVAHTVLPYSDQQLGGSLGGPIVKDKIQFFAASEYEREPLTVFMQPPLLPGESFTLLDKQITKLGLGRVDFQLGKDHLSARWTGHNFQDPYGGLTGTTFPSYAQDTELKSNNLLGTWSRVINNTTVSELRGSYNGVYFFYGNLPQYGCSRFVESGCGQSLNQFVDPQRVPLFIFPGGLNIGPRGNQTLIFYQHNPSIRYDLTKNSGSHNIKIGGEWIWHNELGEWHQTDRGNFTFSAVPPDVTSRFPQSDWDNPAAWNLAGLQQYAISFQQGFHQTWLVHMDHTLWAGWIGDTWRASPTLTLNFGLRYDLDYGIFTGGDVTSKQILINNGKNSGNYGAVIPNYDWTNFAPRAGFVYNVGGSDKMVVRGGSGLYYSQLANNGTDNLSLYNNMVSGQWFYTGQPDFMTNPRGGITQAQMLACNVPANCQVKLPAQTSAAFSDGYKNPYTWQTSVGFQRQLAATTGLDVDLTYWHWYHDRITYDPNLFYNPLTGYPKPPAQGRPNPAYANIIFSESTGRRDYLAMPVALTRRMSNKLQAGLNYTLMFHYMDTGGSTNAPNNPFDPVEGEWARSLEFQRHTLRTYAIYQLPWKTSISGSYFYGSGNPYQVTVAQTPFGIPSNNRYNALAPITVPAAALDRYDGPSVICTGCVVPRDSLFGLPLHKVDMRLNKEIVLTGSYKVALIAEVFNVFNHANYGNYVTQINNARFGQPAASTGNAYQARRAQLAVHMTF